MAKKTKDGLGMLADLKTREAKAKALLAEVRALFPEARALPKDDRRRSRGKLGRKEGTALRGVLDAIDLEPAIFASLADEDEGHDPGKLETDLLRERFDCHQIYSGIAAEMESVASVLSDAALAHGALVKPVTLAAYEIASAALSCEAPCPSQDGRAASREGSTPSFRVSTEHHAALRHDDRRRVARR